jgi:hypothetical protein
MSRTLVCLKCSCPRRHTSLRINGTCVGHFAGRRRRYDQLDTFRKGPNGIEVIMFSNSIATIGLMRTVSKRVTDPPRRFRRTSPSGERASSIET